MHIAEAMLVLWHEFYFPGEKKCTWCGFCEQKWESYTDVYRQMWPSPPLPQPKSAGRKLFLILKAICMGKHCSLLSWKYPFFQRGFLSKRVKMEEGSCQPYNNREMIHRHLKLLHKSVKKHTKNISILLRSVLWIIIWKFQRTTKTNIKAHSSEFIWRAKAIGWK